MREGISTIKRLESVTLGSMGSRCKSNVLKQLNDLVLFIKNGTLYASNSCVTFVYNGKWKYIIENINYKPQDLLQYYIVQEMENFKQRYYTSEGCGSGDVEYSYYDIICSYDNGRKYIVCDADNGKIVIGQSIDKLYKQKDMPYQFSYQTVKKTLIKELYSDISELGEYSSLSEYSITKVQEKLEGIESSIKRLQEQAVLISEQKQDVQTCIGLGKSQYESIISKLDNRQKLVEQDLQELEQQRDELLQMENKIEEQEQQVGETFRDSENCFEESKYQRLN